MPSKNVEPILNLGDTRYVRFRRDVFIIRPVPYKLGERVSDVYVQAVHHAADVAKTGGAASAVAYYRGLDQLARLLWTHMVPMRRIPRWLRALHLLRNPFRQASEVELRQIVDFFLQCRMTSSVQAMSATTLGQPSSMH